MPATFDVQKIHCGGCARTVTRAVQSVEPSAEVNVDRASGRVTVAPAGDPAAISRAITAAGYPARQAT